MWIVGHHTAMARNSVAFSILDFLLLSNIAFGLKPNNACTLYLKKGAKGKFEPCLEICVTIMFSMSILSERKAPEQL